MAPTTLHDPVGALIQWLKDEDNDLWPANFTPIVTHFPQTSEAGQINEKSRLVVAVKSAGIGSGAGQLAMARYRSIRIDAIASAETDWQAWNLGLFMNEAILSARGANLDTYDYDGITYDTKFVNLVQTGGPAPFDPVPFQSRGTPGRGPDYRSVLYVYNVNFTTF